MAKVIIDIDNDVLEELYEPEFGCGNALCYAGQAIRDGIVLPDNPTNGDVMEALFPNATIKEKPNFSNGFILPPTMQIITDEWVMGFSYEWWSAPYKGE